MKERRKFARIKRESLAEYKELEFSFKDNGYASTSIKNISGNGLLFLSEQNFDIGAKLSMKLKIIGWDKQKNDFYRYDETVMPEPLSVIARVVRIEELKQDCLYEIGVEFINIETENSEALKEYISMNLEN